MQNVELVLEPDNDDVRLHPRNRTQRYCPLLAQMTVAGFYTAGSREGVQGLLLSNNNKNLPRNLRLPETVTLGDLPPSYLQNEESPPPHSPRNTGGRV